MDSVKTKNPIIQPREAGAIRDLPSILSVLDIRFISLGKSILLEAKPKTALMAITAAVTIIVPLEKPAKTVSPDMNSSSCSMIWATGVH